MQFKNLKALIKNNWYKRQAGKKKIEMGLRPDWQLVSQILRNLNEPEPEPKQNMSVILEVSGESKSSEESEIQKGGQHEIEMPDPWGEGKRENAKEKLFNKEE